MNRPHMPITETEAPTNLHTAVSAAASHSRKAFLDLAWERINALGGFVSERDLNGQGYNRAISDALAIIESLGGGSENRARTLLTVEDQPNRVAFSNLLKRLANDPPPPIVFEADHFDLEAYAEHMQKLLENVERYTAAVLADMQRRTSGGNLDVNVLGILSDTRGDIVGTLKIAAEQMREEIACWCEFEEED